MPFWLLLIAAEQFPSHSHTLCMALEGESAMRRVGIVENADISITFINYRGNLWLCFCAAFATFCTRVLATNTGFPIFFFRSYFFQIIQFNLMCARCLMACQHHNIRATDMCWSSCWARMHSSSHAFLSFAVQLASCIMHIVIYLFMRCSNLPS